MPRSNAGEQWAPAVRVLGDASEQFRREPMLQRGQPEAWVAGHGDGEPRVGRARAAAWPVLDQRVGGGGSGGGMVVVGGGTSRSARRSAPGLHPPTAPPCACGAAFVQVI